MKNLEARQDAFVVRTTLLGAARLVRERGHARGTMQAPTGELCVLGAIRRQLAESIPWSGHLLTVEEADRWNRLVTAASTRVSRTLINRGGNGFVAQWNDVECTGSEQAAQLLEAAAGIEALP